MLSRYPRLFLAGGTSFPLSSLLFRYLRFLVAIVACSSCYFRYPNVVSALVACSTTLGLYFSSHRFIVVPVAVFLCFRCLFSMLHWIRVSLFIRSVVRCFRLLHLCVLSQYSACQFSLGFFVHWFFDFAVGLPVVLARNLGFLVLGLFVRLISLLAGFWILLILHLSVVVPPHAVLRSSGPLLLLVLLSHVSSLRLRRALVLSQHCSDRSSSSLGPVASLYVVIPAARSSFDRVFSRLELMLGCLSCLSEWDFRLLFHAL